MGIQEESVAAFKLDHTISSFSIDSPIYSQSDSMLSYQPVEAPGINFEMDEISCCNRF